MPRRTAIGLDIGTSVVRAVELSFGRSGITLERFGQLVLPPDAVHDGQVVDSEAVAKAHTQAVVGHEADPQAGRARRREPAGDRAPAGAAVARPETSSPRACRSRCRTCCRCRSTRPSSTSSRSRSSPTDGGSRTLKGLLVAAARETVLANVRAAELGRPGRPGRRPHPVRGPSVAGAPDGGSGRDRGPHRHRRPGHQHRRSQRGSATVRPHPARRRPGRHRRRGRAARGARSPRPRSSSSRPAGSVRRRGWRT